MDKKCKYTPLQPHQQLICFHMSWLSPFNTQYFLLITCTVHKHPQVRLHKHAHLVLGYIIILCTVFIVYKPMCTVIKRSAASANTAGSYSPLSDQLSCIIHHFPIWCLKTVFGDVNARERGEIYRERLTL